MTLACTNVNVFVGQNFRPFTILLKTSTVILYLFTHFLGVNSKDPEWHVIRNYVIRSSAQI